MAKNIDHVQHIKSKNVVEIDGVKSPKLPNPSALTEGEIAINYAKDYETISLKNESGDVVTFSSDKKFYTKDEIDASEKATSAALNDLNRRKLDASAYTPSVELWVSGTGLNSVVQKGSSGVASGNYAIAEGYTTSATSQSSHAEGAGTTASGGFSHAEGGGTTASGDYSHAEGASTTASGSLSHAEGAGSKAIGNYSHAEGNSTSATSNSSHAEGQNTIASDYQSHAEGFYTIASGSQSHAEGNNTIASGFTSHAEGYYTKANGGYGSHAEGQYTIANNQSEHASGQYNISSSGSSTFGDSGNTLFSVGNGTSDNARHNAFEIRQNGDIYIVSGGTDILLQDHIGGGGGSITVDQVLDDTTSASTNPVSSKAVYDAVTDNELVWTNAYVTLSGTVSAHTADTSIHLVSGDREKLNNITGTFGTMAYENTSSYSSATEVNTALDDKLESSDIADFFDDAKYEDSGNTKVINFYNGNTLKATIDASDFIIDGMVESVSAGTSGSTTVLDIKWNTAAGGQETILDIGDIFEADNYYTKTEVDARDLWVSGTSSDSVALKGGNNVSSGGYSVAEGYATSATSTNSHAEGLRTLASGLDSHAEGSQTSATSMDTHAEGYGTLASDYYSHAEGLSTVASGTSSHAEGYNTIAGNQYCHAEGNNTIANGISSHAEGYYAKANGDYSHAEGYRTSAFTQYSHAEGDETIANGNTSHAEGCRTSATSYYTHAEGYGTLASGSSSHAEGESTITLNSYEHASGKHNVSNYATPTFGDSGNTLFSVGNGKYNSELGAVVRHNAFEIRQNGDIYIVSGGTDILLQDHIGGGGGSITVDQVIDSGTSASTNAVATKAVYDYLESNFYTKDDIDNGDEAISSALNNLNKRVGIVSAITVNSNLSDVTCPSDITGLTNSGSQANIIYVNGGLTSTYTITVTSSYKTPDGNQLELVCPINGYCEINYLNINGTIYARGI